MVVFPDSFRPQPSIAAINEFLASEIPKNFLLQRFQRSLLVCASREKGKCKGDSVPVHEKSHLDNRVRSVLLSLSILLAAVFLLNLEIIIRAVIIKDLIISLSKETAVFIEFCLDQVALRTKDIQRAVYVMKLIGRFLQKLQSSFVGRTLAARFHDPGIDQVGKDGVDIILEFIFLF